jgi:hypothetical protein
MPFNVNLNIFLALGLAAVLFLAIGSMLWQYGRAEEMLEAWAARHQLQIEQREHRHLFKGPFFWNASRGQFVYRVVVRDQYGQRRVAWVKLGSWFFGILQNKVQVVWETEQV